MWSYNSTPPTCLHIVYKEEFNFTIYSSFLPLLFLPTFPCLLRILFLTCVWPSFVTRYSLSLLSSSSFVTRHSLSLLSPYLRLSLFSLTVFFLPQASVCFFRLTSRYTDLDLASRKQFMSLCKQCYCPPHREKSLKRSGSARPHFPKICIIPTVAKRPVSINTVRYQLL
jgi:hypothetical protein